jgi:GDP-4-dehydro-6-deoxy-D-mannose reductase
MINKPNISKVSRVLITGISGSGGSYLAEFIVKNKECEIHGISRWHSTSKNSNLSEIANKVTVHESDLNDFSSVIQTLEKVKPDIIFHLASYANVRASFDTPATVLHNNIIGTSNLFEAIRFLKLDPIIQMCSTSEVYGQVSSKEVPIKESAPIRPASPYAVSKVAQDLLARTYFVSYDMKVVITRMFAYLNPRRDDLFASAFAKQVARIELGLQKTLYHGNLDSIRTIIDVRDGMRAYWDAAIYCEYGEAYNIGGTTQIKVGELLDRLISLSSSQINTKIKKSLLRPADVTLQIPDNSKFNKATGFKTLYSFDESMEDLLNYWRNKAQEELVLKSQTKKG